MCYPTCRLFLKLGAVPRSLCVGVGMCMSTCQFYYVVCFVCSARLYFVVCMYAYHNVCAYYCIQGGRFMFQSVHDYVDCQRQWPFEDDHIQTPGTLILQYAYVHMQCFIIVKHRCIFRYDLYAYVIICMHFLQSMHAMFILRVLSSPYGFTYYSSSSQWTRSRRACPCGFLRVIVISLINPLTAHLAFMFFLCISILNFTQT